MKDSEYFTQNGISIKYVSMPEENSDRIVISQLWWKNIKSALFMDYRYAASADNVTAIWRVYPKKS